MSLDSLRAKIDPLKYADEAETLARLKSDAALSPTDRARICANAATLVRDIRASSKLA